MYTAGARARSVDSELDAKENPAGSAPGGIRRKATLSARVGPSSRTHYISCDLRKCGTESGSLRRSLFVSLPSCSQNDWVVVHILTTLFSVYSHEFCKTDA